MEIAVCVSTYKRAGGLRQLLESLVAQQGIDGRFGIVVVDNDPEASAGPTVADFRGRGPEIRYAAEPDPGIPAARNRSVAIAREAAASTVAFIDDDEFASPYWLATMVQRLETTGADVASGPVEPIFSTEAPAWAIHTRLYHRATFPDGAGLDYASTANAVMRLEAIGGDVAPFNPDFRFSGGSDSLLFHSLRAKGARIIWEPSGLVYENVPSDRLSLRWLALRRYRQGITLARCDRLIYSSRLKLARRAVRGFAQFPIGAAQIMLGIARNSYHWRRGVVRIAQGAGVIAGLTGATYDEYRR